MTERDIRKLIGGYATGTLTDDERQALFAAALQDQELFDALADEQAMRELLSDPASRSRLLRALEPKPVPRFAVWKWALAGSLAVTALTVVMVRQNLPKRAAPIEVAEKRAPAPLQLPPPPAAAPPKVLRDMPKPRAGEADEVRKPAVAPAAPPPKAEGFVAGIRKQEARPMRLAVVTAPEPAPIDTESARQLVEQLGKKLDQPGAYSVVDSRTVDKAVQERKLTGPVDASTAASIGRSVGADAVIVADFTPSEAEKGKDVRLRREQAQQAVAFRANAIDTRTAANLAMAQAQLVQTFGGGVAQTKLADPVDQVAAQLSSQLARARPRIEAAITDVNGSILSLNIGLKAGVKPGETYRVFRDGKVLGTLTVTKADHTFTVGWFVGDQVPATGDKIVLQ